MNTATANFVASQIARRVGIPTTARLLSSEQLLLAPQEVDATTGFAFDLATGWRHIEVSLRLGHLARPLIVRMGEASAVAKANFAALAAHLSKRATVRLQINEQHHDPTTPTEWPARWDAVVLHARQGGVIFEEIGERASNQLIADLLVATFGMVAVMIGVDGVEADVSAQEGARVNAVSVRYERKPINREICLSLRGNCCYCCGFDFGKKYGSYADGFIEVHHKVPVSEIGTGYTINPLEDLVPVCSNCHSVIHMVAHTLDPDDLRQALERRAE
jgi:5-methylcytosine-specific restriction protein A